MKSTANQCPFCGKTLKDGRPCGRTACQAKAAVWNSKRGR